MSKQPKIPSASESAVAGIQSDLELAPFEYLIRAASSLGKNITLDGKEYDFTGLGDADTARVVGDKMAQTLLELQREKNPQIIAQRLAELKAADPEGYATRQQLFDRIMADAQSNPGRPVSDELQRQLQDEISRGVGFADAKQESQVREGVRGRQAKSGITLGAAPTSEEAKTVTNAGESLRSRRQQNALDLLQSGASPEDVAFRKFQQTLSNLGAFQAGQTPQAQFRQVSSAGNGPVDLTGNAPGPSQFNPNAAAGGVSNAFDQFGTETMFSNSQVNPWLAGISIGAQGVGAAANIKPNWFRSTPFEQPTGTQNTPWGSYYAG